MIKLSPVLDGLGTYPFVRLRGRPRAAARGRHRDHRLRHGRAARGDAARSSARRWRPRSSRSRPTRAPWACPSCARRSRRGRAAASARRWTPTRRSSPRSGSKEAVFGLAHVFGGDQVVIPQPALPGLRPRRALRRQGDRRAAAARGGRLAAGPGRDRRLVARVDPVAQLPEQPDGRDRPARVLRARPRRWRASTGSCSPPTRPTPSCTSATRRPQSALAARRPDATSRVLNTLSKRSSMPGYRSGFVAGDPEIVAALKNYRPNVGVAPPEFVQRAAIAAWNEEDARRPRCAPATAPSATCCCPRCEAIGLRSAGGDASFFLWMEGSDELAAALARAGRHRRARLVLRSRGRGLPAARARPAARGDRARDRAHARVSRWRAGPR